MNNYQVALKDIVEPVERSEAPIPGKIYKQIGVRLWGEGAYQRESIDGSQTKYKKLFKIDTNDIVVNKIWARNGSVTVIPSNLSGCYVSNEFPSFKPNLDELDPRWFYWFTKTKSCWQQCDEKSRGTSGKNRIRPEKFLEVEILLPSLEEQRRIVAKVEELGGKLEEARSLREQTIKETSILYNSALSSLIDSDCEGWKQAKIEDVILNMGAGWSPQCEKYPASKGEWGVLKTTSVQWNRFFPSENKALPPSLKPRPALCVEEGDILVTRAGPRKRVGVVAAVRESNPRLMISDKIIRLKPNEQEINPLFLEISLASPFSQKYFFNRKTGLADAQVNISQTILRATPITYPCLKEQERIVDYLDRLQSKVDEMKRLREQSLQELDALLPSILDKAFKGEL